MPEITILRPAYYGRLACKCGDCRSTCCAGWPVRMSSLEYYRLLGADFPADVREKLDCALQVCENPTAEGYAVMAADARGCRMQDEQGLCALQKARGASAPPLVCRLYPRAVHMGQCPEISCSGSCEKTVELLLEGPLTFGTVPAVYDGTLPPREAPERTSLRMRCIGLMQCSAFPLSERVWAVGEAVGTALPRLPEGSAAFGEAARRLYRALSPASPALQACGAPEAHMQGVSAAVLPDAEVVYERLLVNHMFYMQFPFTGAGTAAADAAWSFAAAYLLLRTLTAGAQSRERFVDLAAQVFRCAEHSAFYPDAGKALRGKLERMQDA